MADTNPATKLDERNERNANSTGTRSFKRPKDIFLFSDGTGNSSGKLFKTNVWRLYEALDLGEPVNPGNRVQIAYYDNGVGTSGFRPIAVLGGVFGYGLVAGVKRLYKFLCRNYQPEDRIHVFGFSRGAFTIRLLIGLIASQGIIRYIDESELSAQTEKAWKAFRSTFVVSNIIAAWVSSLWKKRDKRANPEIDAHSDVSIEFVGLWDSVSAYGGPFIEITRGFDKWLWPLTLDDYKLTPKVICARHALAIDDQRDAFQPLLWDEMHEREMTAAGQIAPGRMKQVWFSGMHADVGGGYPDECLSYVSLVWIIDELNAHSPDIRLLKMLEDRVREMSNVYGPIHDSREGAGGYYRFQPRKIAALIAGAGNETATQIYRDPQIARKLADRGLIAAPALVHQSVFDRIAAGTDGYAPINLPASMAVVPSSRPTPGQAAMTNYFAQQLADPAFAKIADLQETLWDFVWQRRVLYFLTVLATVVLVLMPWWNLLDANTQQLLAEHVDDRAITGLLAQIAALVLPGFAERWVDAVAQHPVWTGGLVAAIIILAGLSNKARLNHGNRSAYLWRASLRLPLTRQYIIPLTTMTRRFRENKWYQRFFAALKWTVLPNLVGLFFVATIPYAVAIAAMQVILNIAEKHSTFCKSDAVALAPNFSYSPKTACQPVAMHVTKGNSYTVRIVAVNWRDEGGGAVRQPYGLTAFSHGILGALSAPFRRVVPAGYLEPIIMIRSPAKHGKSAVDVQRLAWSVTNKNGVDRWEGYFDARRDGELAFFINDAVLPFDLTSRKFLDWTGQYRANSGCSNVMILATNEIDERTDWPATPACEPKP